MNFLENVATQVISRLAVRAITWMIERIATSEFAADVVDGIRARCQYAGHARGLRSALGSLPAAIGSRLGSIPDALALIRDATLPGIAALAPVCFFSAVVCATYLSLPLGLRFFVTHAHLTGFAASWLLIAQGVLTLGILAIDVTCVARAVAAAIGENESVLLRIVITTGSIAGLAGLVPTALADLRHPSPLSLGHAAFTVAMNLVVPTVIAMAVALAVLRIAEWNLARGDEPIWPRRRPRRRIPLTFFVLTLHGYMLLGLLELFVLPARSGFIPRQFLIATLLALAFFGVWQIAARVGERFSQEREANQRRRQLLGSFGIQHEVSSRSGYAVAGRTDVHAASPQGAPRGAVRGGVGSRAVNAKNVNGNSPPDRTR